jgi:hypothetical protein
MLFRKHDSEVRGRHRDRPHRPAARRPKRSCGNHRFRRSAGLNCRTIFFLDRNDGTLETFYTAQPRYSEGHGVRIGMTSGPAERLLHKRLREGCETNIYLSSPSATLTIAFADGKADRHLHVTGAHVFAFVLHSDRRDAGVFDCL